MSFVIRQSDYVGFAFNLVNWNSSNAEHARDLCDFGNDKHSKVRTLNNKESDNL